MNLKLAQPLMLDSIVDGPGLRMVLWTQGCNHNCKGCHNPQTHDVIGGLEFDTSDIIEAIKKSRIQKGITFSGGEPFLQTDALIEIARASKQKGLDIWVYTGYTIESLINKKNPDYLNNLNLLKNIDVLVDGKFLENKKDIFLKFRGSRNQRIIDVNKSLKSKCVVLHSKYMNENDEIPIFK